jgi:hypothetical protein
MSDGIERAAQRIVDDAGAGRYAREDARVILDATKQATQHLRAADTDLRNVYLSIANPTDRAALMRVMQHREAALACLQGDDA